MHLTLCFATEPMFLLCFQHWPLVWGQFEAEGAATMYSEDLPQFNMFDYVSTGKVCFTMMNSGPAFVSISKCC